MVQNGFINDTVDQLLVKAGEKIRKRKRVQLSRIDEKAWQMRRKKFGYQ